MKPARPLALLALIALPAPAGVLHGVALENQTSRPIARARIHLYRLEGNQLKSTQTVIASRSGQFFFSELPGG